MSEIKEEYYLKEKYDLEEILNPLYNTKQKYYEWCTKRGIEDYSLIFVIDQIRASCLSPAYNYNRLVDEIIQDLFWDQIKYTISEEQWVSMGRRTEQIIIAVQNCLISIKIALDRLIKIIRLYKSGIAEYTTFGHIDEKTNKAKGFMAQVVRDKEKDEILRYIYQEYDKWIRKCVEPRVAIIHYDDITIKYYFENMKEIPEFICRKKEKQISFSFEDITYYVQSFYSFLEVVVNKVYKELKMRE